MKNVLFLLLADIIWGAAFVAQRTGGDAVGAYSFNCVRCLIGFVVLLPVIGVMDKIRGRKPMDKKQKKTLLMGGILCGTALFFASNLQQLGITLGASVGKAGFLTACYILFVPLLGVFFHKKLGWNVIVAVLLAVLGLYMLCMTGGTFFLSRPDLLLLLCAVCFAVQIMAIDHFAPLVDVVRLSCMEFLVCGILSAIPMFVVDMQHSLEGIVSWSRNLTTWDAWIPILYAGICSCGIAYTLQMAGQKNFNPTIASLIMSLESAFSVLFGWLLLGEKLSAREWVGILIIFAAILIAQVKNHPFIGGENR